jgi:hypothetical protein
MKMLRVHNVEGYRDGIFKHVKSPGIDSKEIDAAGLCSLAGRYDNPILTRFLAPIDCLKIPAQGSQLGPETEFVNF